MRCEFSLRPHDVLGGYEYLCHGQGLVGDAVEQRCQGTHPRERRDGDSEKVRVSSLDRETGNRPPKRTPTPCTFSRPTTAITRPSRLPDYVSLIGAHEDGPNGTHLGDMPACRLAGCLAGGTLAGVRARVGWHVPCLLACHRPDRPGCRRTEGRSCLGRGCAGEAPLPKLQIAHGPGRRRLTGHNF